MAASVRIDPAEFVALPLEAHAILARAGARLKDVSAIDLAGGGPGRTMMDLRAVLAGRSLRDSGLVVSALFGLRMAMGRLFGWDRERQAVASWSLLGQVPPAVAGRSLVPPGTAEGGFRYLYVLPGESLSEIRNATVHAFICAVLTPVAVGYRMYWGIYVKRVSWLTPIYMAAIEPFRRYLVYPAIFRRIKEAWRARFAE